MSGVAIAGVGMSAFGRFADQRLEDLAWQAIEPALLAAGAEPEEVDAVFVGTVFGPAGVASRVARAAGLTGGAPAIAVEAACASGTVAATMAVQAIESGTARCALALGLDQLTVMVDGAIEPEPTDVDGRAGLAMPAMYALSAQWYLDTYGVDAERLALVAEKNLRNASRNPRSLARPARSVEEILASRMIADPLTVLQCCPVSDGAGAAVFRPSTGRDEVVVRSHAVVGGRAWPGLDDEAWASACVRRARDQVEAQVETGLGTADLFEVHDAFTIGEILTVEALGLAGPGEAGSLLADGVFDRDGVQPVNPSGGLLGRGHPLGATGLAQIAETWLQLRGLAGDVQVPGARRGVVETMGGGAAGLDGNVAAIMVLDAV